MKCSLFASLILMMAISFGKEIKCIYKWKYPSYEAENKTEINLKSCLLYSAAQTNDGKKTFVTTIKQFCPDAPASLTMVSHKEGSGGPLLRPYPNWNWHKSSCSGITNVPRVFIKCDYLFALDNGKIGCNKESKECKKLQECNPKILIFDLKTDKLVTTIQIPIDMSHNTTGKGLLVDILVHFQGKCSQILQEMKIFVADIIGYGLVMYDASTKHMCRIESDHMKATDTEFSVQNQNFSYPGGIDSLGILNKGKKQDYLTFTPVAGKKVYKMKMEDVIKCPNRAEANKQTKVVMNLSSQSGYVASEDNTIFYSNANAISLNVANVCEKNNKTFVKKKVLAKGSKNLESIISIQIAKNSKKTLEIIGLSDRFHRYATNTVNPSETNACIFKYKLDKDKCDSSNNY